MKKITSVYKENDSSHSLSDEDSWSLGSDLEESEEEEQKEEI